MPTKCRWLKYIDGHKNYSWKYSFLVTYNFSFLPSFEHSSKSDHHLSHFCIELKGHEQFAKVYAVLTQTFMKLTIFWILHMFYKLCSFLWNMKIKCSLPSIFRISFYLSNIRPGRSLEFFSQIQLKDILSVCLLDWPRVWHHVGPSSW